MFIDRRKIYLKGGDGGRGCVSFRREKYVPKGGPSGGDGGNGGDVIVQSDAYYTTLAHLKNLKHYKAERGRHGSGSNRHGKSGGPLLLSVPVGTLVKDEAEMLVLFDFTEPGQTYAAAKGGKGGKGNAFFKTSTNRAPDYAQPGISGEEKTVILELKLLADVGLIGLPNAGKSTLISRISAAKPRIADYPFTTLEPNLGVVRLEDFRSFVVADIPGLIEGAHQGAGLGTRFLKHIERTKVLVHLLDAGTDACRDLLADYHTVNREMEQFSPMLLKKPQIIALNKMDLLRGDEIVRQFLKQFSSAGIPEVYPVSAVSGAGVDRLLTAMVSMLDRIRKEEAENITKTDGEI